MNALRSRTFRQPMGMNPDAMAHSMPVYWGKDDHANVYRYNQTRYTELRTLCGYPCIYDKNGDNGGAEITLYGFAVSIRVGKESEAEAALECLLDTYRIPKAQKGDDGCNMVVLFTYQDGRLQMERERKHHTKLITEATRRRLSAAARCKPKKTREEWLEKLRQFPLPDSPITIDKIKVYKHGADRVPIVFFEMRVEKGKSTRKIQARGIFGVNEVEVHRVLLMEDINNEIERRVNNG